MDYKAIKYAINGRFITQRVTGVQRVEREIVFALDNNLKTDSFCIVVPEQIDIGEFSKLKKIIIVKYGRHQNHLWEQIDLPYFIKKNGLLGIHLGNTAPLIKPDIVFIHDMNLVRNPKWFKLKFRIWYKIQYINTFKRSIKILTNSNFSKNEMLKCYKCNSDKIQVLPLGWQHFKIDSNCDIETKYGLKKYEYFFSLYQMQAYKNFKWIVEVAKRNPQQIFVVTGWRYNKVSVSKINEKEIRKCKNIKILGYISDEDIVALIRNCKAFLFPSKYEGFGLPPLEAMGVGCKCICVGDIPVMHEVFGSTVNYIETGDFNYDFENLIKVDEMKSKNILEKYSWVETVKILETILEEID